LKKADNHKHEGFEHDRGRLTSAGELADEPLTIVLSKRPASAHFRN
jgi:hypothetical protein